MNLLLIPISELSEILDQTQTAIAGWRKILGVLATPIDVEEPVDGVDAPAGALAVDLDGRALRLPHRRRGAPRHRPRTCPPAPRSPSSARRARGKTTIAKLLCRLADPTEGTVRVGGVDLRTVDPDVAPRVRSGWCPQDGFLFDTTLADNVRVGRPDADDDEVRAAFTTLGLGGWLDDLPGGLDAEVGERGGNLSVGERQLVALARAQLGDPGLLILDEATSSVDPETEQALTEALDRLSAGRTVVSIAHRLSTAERADLVLVVDAGRDRRAGHPRGPGRGRRRLRRPLRQLARQHPSRRSRRLGVASRPCARRVGDTRLRIRVRHAHLSLEPIGIAEEEARGSNRSR